MLLKNELKFVLSKRKLLCFVALVVGIILVFYFKYNVDYMTFREQQIDYYSEMIDMENQRMNILSESEWNAVFKEDLVHCQKLLSDWKNNTDKEIIAQDLYDRDRVLLEYVESGVHIDSFTTILQDTVKDLKTRTKMERFFIKNEYYDFIFKNKPTGCYLLVQITKENNLFFYLLFIMVVILNTDIWSKDFETKCTHFLFTAGKGRRCVFLIRTGIRHGITIFITFIFLLFLFLMGYANYGSGIDMYVETVPVTKYILEYGLRLLVFILFSSSCIQSVSFYLKNTGTCLMIIGLFMLFMYTYLDVATLLRCTSLFVVGTLVAQSTTLLSLERVDIG